MTKKTDLSDTLVAKKDDEPILIGYLPAGYPDKKTSQRWVELLLDNGVDAVELGYPSRSPEMDGKVISEAHKKTYREGFVPEDYVEIGEKVNEGSGINRLIPMGYWSQLKKSFEPEFSNRWKGAGLKHLIFPDLNDEETIKNLEEKGFSLIPFIDNLDNLDIYSGAKKPFVYCPTYHGKTGESGAMNFEHLENLKRRLENSKFETTPHLAGFGISSGQDANAVMNSGYDGVIVGSVLISAFSESENRAIELLEELKKGIGKE